MRLVQQSHRDCYKKEIMKQVFRNIGMTQRTMVGGNWDYVISDPRILCSVQNWANDLNFILMHKANI